MDLTPRQRQILTFIQQQIAELGRPPTRSEIARAFGFRSANAAQEHLRNLERKGAIALTGGASRGIRLLAGAAAGLPLVGRVAAGQPILAEEQIEARYALDPGLFHPHAHYLLRVRGESMRDAGIRDGDLLAVHRTREAGDGRIVVARVEDEVTVKRLYRKGHEVELRPANPAFESLRIDLRSTPLEIEGIAVGLVRQALDSIAPVSLD